MSIRAIKSSFPLVLLVFVSLFFDTVMAQEKCLGLEELNFGGVNYHKFTPENRYTTWWGDVLVRQEADQCSTVDRQTGRETPIFTLEEVNTWAGTNEQNKIRSLFPSEFPYAGKPVVLLKSKCERLLVDFKKHCVLWRQDCQGETHEEFNALSKAVAFVKDDNLFVRQNDDLEQLTTDGSRDIVYGQSVHRDEFGIYKGTFFSNDGWKLAFYRMDQSLVTDYPLADYDARIAEHSPIKYPMAGQASHTVAIGVYDLKTRKTVYLNTGDATNRYFTNIQWSPDNKTIYLKELNRKQTDMKLDAYDAETGEYLRTLYKEHDDKYVQPKTAIYFLPWDSDKFILESEKDGFNHLYLLNTKGEQLGQLTKGNFEVLDFIGFNPKTRCAIILTNEASPIQNNAYAVNIATKKRTLLDNGEGCHVNIYSASGHRDKALSPSGTYLLDSWTAPEVPRIIDVINTATGKRTGYLKAKDPWQGYNLPIYTLGTIKAADGVTDLYYRMVKPHDFDQTKKYPTIVYVYGGPNMRNVEARWHYWSRSWETYMAEKGYVLFILDNRGSCSRGRAFEQATFHHLGQQEMLDQMRGVEFLKSLPYVDSSRLGVHGWSFGGFMTISLMTNYPDVFKVGVAGGPVIDWKWYEVMYGERYMGTPQDNKEGFEKSSLIEKAKCLKGKLQIIIGLSDPVVVPQHSFEFIKACIEAGTQPDFFVYPGEPHNMRGHQSVHLHERITQYFEDYLK